MLAHVSCATALTDKVKYIHSDFSNLDCLLCLDTAPIRVWKLSAHIETDTHYSYNLSYWFHPHCFIGTLASPPLFSRLTLAGGVSGLHMLYKDFCIRFIRIDFKEEYLAFVSKGKTNLGGIG